MIRLQATFIRSSPGFMEEANKRAEVRDKRDGGKDTPTRQGRLPDSPVYPFDNKALSLGVRDTLLRYHITKVKCIWSPLPYFYIVYCILLSGAQYGV